MAAELTDYLLREFKIEVLPNAREDDMACITVGTLLRLAALATQQATQGAELVAGYCTGIAWHPKTTWQSEQVIKITRKAQPEHGFVVPLYTAPPPTAEVEKDAIPEGCTPADARVLREANHLLAETEQRLRRALRFYAAKYHFGLSDPDAWDTVSGEPTNFWCDEAGTATVEVGWVAQAALRGEADDWGEDGPPPLCPGEPEHIMLAALQSEAQAGKGDGHDQ